MSGWLYLIRNGDLYKIGITRNFDNRMRQLKPDEVIVRLYSSEFKLLERQLHKRYRNVRIPQTEYFRLNLHQIREVKQRISKLNYPISITFDVLIKSFILLLLLFLSLVLLKSLTINEFNIILLSSLTLMEKISFVFSFLSLFIKSDKFLSLINEFKFRLSRFCILFLFAFFFRFASVFFMS